MDTLIDNIYLYHYFYMGKINKILELKILI